MFNSDNSDFVVIRNSSDSRGNYIFIADRPSLSSAIAFVNGEIRRFHNAKYVNISEDELKFIDSLRNSDRLEKGRIYNLNDVLSNLF